MLTEEILLKDYHLPSSLIGAFEGLFAIVTSIIMIPILNSIQSNFIDYELFFNQMNSSRILIMSSIAICFCDMLYTLSAIMITQHTNGIVRSSVYQLRCIGVWIMALMLDNPENIGGGKWEKFSIFQLFGYSILGLGVFIFNQMINIPFFNTEHENKQNLIHKKRDKKEYELSEI